jgi:hypothetical protein
MLFSRQLYHVRPRVKHPPAITFVNETNGASDTDGITFTTASVAFQNNKLYILSFVCSATTPAVPEVSGGGLNWVLQTDTRSTAAHRLLTFTGSTASGATTGAVTITEAAGVAYLRGAWSIERVENARLSVSVSQWRCEDGSPVTAANLATFPNGGIVPAYHHPLNATFQATARTAAPENMTPGAGFTELADVQAATENIQIQTQWAPGKVDPNVTWTTAGRTLFATLEIAHAHDVLSEIWPVMVYPAEGLFKGVGSRFTGGTEGITSPMGSLNGMYYTWQNNVPYLLSITFRDLAPETESAAPSVSGGGLTWTLVASIPDSTSNQWLCLYQGFASSGASFDDLTITFQDAKEAVSVAAWAVYNGQPTNLIAQSKTSAQASASSATVTLDNARNYSENVFFGSFSHEGDVTYTVGSGFTAFHQVTQATSTRHHLNEYTRADDLSVDASWTVAGITLAIAFEVNHVDAPVILTVSLKADGRAHALATARLLLTAQARAFAPARAAVQAVRVVPVSSRAQGQAQGAVLATAIRFAQLRVAAGGRGVVQAVLIALATLRASGRANALVAARRVALVSAAARAWGVSSAVPRRLLETALRSTSSAFTTAQVAAPGVLLKAVAISTSRVIPTAVRTVQARAVGVGSTRATAARLIVAQLRAFAGQSRMSVRLTVEMSLRASGRAVVRSAPIRVAFASAVVRGGTFARLAALRVQFASGRAQGVNVARALATRVMTASARAQGSTRAILTPVRVATASLRAGVVSTGTFLTSALVSAILSASGRAVVRETPTAVRRTAGFVVGQSSGIILPRILRSVQARTVGASRGLVLPTRVVPLGGASRSSSRALAVATLLRLAQLEAEGRSSARATPFFVGRTLLRADGGSRAAFQPVTVIRFVSLLTETGPVVVAFIIQPTGEIIRLGPALRPMGDDLVRADRLPPRMHG